MMRRKVLCGIGALVVLMVMGPIVYGFIAALLWCGEQDGWIKFVPMAFSGVFVLGWIVVSWFGLWQACCEYWGAR